MSPAITPFVSVVIPTYNQAHFLGKALQSVRDQTYTKWEVIVVDNHSSDNTSEVIQNLADSRITYLKIHNNGVIAASRNMGIRAAKGDWIAFLDSDDHWYPDKLEIVCNGINEDPSIDVWSTDELLVDETTGESRLLKYGPYTAGFYERLLIKGNCLSPSATMVRSSFLFENNVLFREDKEFVTVEDYDLWMILAQKGAKFKFINTVLGEYLVHGENNSVRNQLHRQNLINVLKNHVYQMQTFQENKERLWKRINSRILLGSAKNLIWQRQLAAGVQIFMLAFINSPIGCFSYIQSNLAKRLGNNID
ncbi:MAG: glycosyltransferase [Geobacteraceae bacterium]|nr:glycosyltransferase [Geobacteraceae bacterium]